MAKAEDDPNEPTPREVKAAKRVHRGYRWRRWVWRTHLNSYLGVNAGLAALNLLTGGPIWFVYPLVGWGMGLAIHALNHRSWRKENEEPLAKASAILGVRTEAPRGLGEALPSVANRLRGAAAPAGVPGTRAPTAQDREWSVLLERARHAVQAAEESLRQMRGGGGIEAAAQLRAGLTRVEELAEGSKRIRAVLAELAPEGPDALDMELRMLDARIAETGDERLGAVYRSNRGLLATRREKIHRLIADEQRMQASAQGFLLAADNIRLDAARLAAGHSAQVGPGLSAPLERLDDEVALLRQVETELEAL